MFLVRLLVLSLFLVSLVGSQPAHPAGVQSNLGTGNLSFPWSRLRLPRYPSCYFFFFFFNTYEQEVDKKIAGPLFFDTYFFIPGTSFLFTTTSSCTLTSQASASRAQCRSRLTYRTTQTGLCCTARVYRSPRPPYWTRTSHICLTR